MAESAPEWQQKIINTQEKGKKDSAEEAAIAFIEDHIRKGTLPKERIQKLIEAITNVLEQKTHDKEAVLKQCEQALTELKGERGFFDKVTAFVSDAKVQVDIATSTADKIQIFRDGKNDSITVKSFEEELKTKNVTDINSFGFANYLVYLQEKNLCNKDTLERVFGGNVTGKRKLQDLAVLWGLEDTRESVKNTNTQTMLAKISPPLLQNMRKILSDELHEYLNGPKNIHVKDILKTKYKDSFKETEFDSLTKGEILDIKKLAEYLRHLTGKNVKNLQDIEDILTAHKKDIGDEKRKIGMEEKMYHSEKKSGKSPTDIGAERKLAERKKKIEELQLESTVLENPKVRTHLAGYISGKIDQKKFNTVIDNERKRLEKVENEKNPQKSEISNTGDTRNKESGKQAFERRKEPEIGETRTISLSRTDPSLKEMTQVTHTGKDTYTLQIADYEPITSLSVGEKNEYVKSFRFLGNMGLGHLVKHIEPTKLYELMTHKKNGETTSGSIDGRFDTGEKAHFLKSLSRVLGLEGEGIITSGMNYEQMSTKFRTTSLMRGGFEKMLGNSGFMKDGILEAKKFEKAIKGDVHSL